MPDNRSLDLSREDRESAVDEAGKLLSSISFMRSLLTGGNFNMDEANCHLSLIRHGYDALAGLFNMDPLSKELDKSYAMCREANARAADLEKQLGEGVTAAAAASKLSQLEDWFCTWYQLSGFHYMTLEYNKFGLSFETSDEIEHEPVEPENVSFGDRALAVKIAPVVPYAFRDFDLKRDTFHDNIRDTQMNHDALVLLFKSAFPDARVHGFRSHSDGPDEFMLRMKGHVSWADIEKWHCKVLEEADKIKGRNTGALYVRQAELAGKLASRTFTGHAGADLVKAARDELAHVRMVTGLWDQVTELRLADGLDAVKTSETLKLEWHVQRNEVHGHTFRKGTPYKTIENWFEENFKLDVGHDLTGKEAPDGSED